MRRCGDDATHRGQHPVVVGQRLAHAHEDDVGQPAARRARCRRRRDRAARRRRRTCSRISAVDRLRVQAALAGRAERAGHAAAGLRRDAHGVAVRVAHQHRLERRAVDRPPQHLSGLARVALDLARRVEQRREQRVGDLFAHRRGQVGHLVRVGDQPAVVLVGQLLTAKRRQPQVGDGRGAAGLVEVGEVPRRHGASRRIENQGQGGGHELSPVSHLMSRPKLIGDDRRWLATMGAMAGPAMPFRSGVGSDVLLCARLSHWRACCFGDVADGGAGVPVRPGRRDPVRVGAAGPGDAGPQAAPWCMCWSAGCSPRGCCSPACIWR